MFVKKIIYSGEPDFLPFGSLTGPYEGLCKSRYSFGFGGGWWCTRQAGHQNDPSAPSPEVHAAHGDTETQYATWLDEDIITDTVSKEADAQASQAPDTQP